jgi:hypothetical protein
MTGHSGATMCELEEAMPFPGPCDTSGATITGHYSYGGYCNQVYTCQCAPTVTCSASPNPPSYGGNTFVSWSSSGANSCSIANYGSATPTAGGTSNSIGPITSEITRDVSCSNAYGSTVCPLSVTPTPPTPTGWFTTNSCTILSGQGSCLMNVEWGSSNTTGSVTVQRTYAGNSVFASGTSGNNPASWAPPGSYVMALYDGSTWLANGTFNVACEAGTTWSGSVCVPAATATLSVTSPVSSGSRSTITWGSTNATSCTTSSNWSNSGNLSGSGLSDPISVQTTLTYQCTGPGGTSALQSATVYLIATPPTVNIFFQ